MIVRVLCTGATLLLAAAGFLGYGPSPPGINAPGVILCIGAAIVWFGWTPGYSYRREARGLSGKRPDLATIGAAPLLKEQDSGTKSEDGNG